MRYRLLHLLSGAFTLVLASGFGCYTGASIDPNAGLGSGGTSSTVGSTEPAASTVTGIPCDVAAVLAKSCSSCHGSPLAGGAPNRMTTLEDLLAVSRSNPSQNIAQLSVDRMRDAKKPMPPSGPAPDADVAVLEAWIAKGTPRGSCETPLEGGDYATPVTCTSGTTWTRGDHGSDRMRPGHACIECHSRDEGPRYSIAGTVYPTAHEPDDCNGVDDGITVVITGADGKTYTLPVNEVGNFGFTVRVATPYRAKVVGGGKTREMIGPQTDGDCNTCHSVSGAEKAPGRVMAP